VAVVALSACAKATTPGATGDDGDDTPPQDSGGSGSDTPDGGTPLTGCGAPPAPVGGTVNAPSTNTGDIATYGCNSGFALTGNPIATCQANHTWTQAPTCVAALACSAPPPSPVGGSVTAPLLTSGSSATYACGGSQILLKSQHSVCSNGAWIGATPQCATSIDCVCSGEFVQGEAIYAPFANAGMTTGLAAGTTGNVIAGNQPQAPTFGLLVQYNNWHEGHNGRCASSTCGQCTQSGDSKYYVSCTSVATPRLRCACGGAFTEGDRVVSLTNAPSATAGITLGQAGTVIAAAPDKILVEWDNFTGGNDGMCSLATCGRCTPSGTARAWVSCNELGRAP
jgi:hypothetical protein